MSHSVRTLFIRRVASLLFAFAVTSTVAEPSHASKAFMESHCWDCHDADVQKGGLNLYDLTFDRDDPTNLARWALIYDRVAKGEMPPENKRQPKQAERQAFTGQLAATLESAWENRYAHKGRVGGRRLNPTEYENTLRDLLAAPWLELKEMLPPDPEAYGFDNVAEAQEISYVQLARYLEAAEVAIDEAMQLRPAPKPTKVRTWFTEEGRYLGKQWKKYLCSLDKRPEWLFFLSQPNSAQAPRRIRNTSQKIPGWYRFRVRCRAALVQRDKNGQKLLPPEEGQVAWINTAAKRVLGKFDVPAGEGGVVEFTAWQRQDDLLEFFCANLDDRTVNPKKKRDRNPDPTDTRSFDYKYRGHGVAVDWIEIEGPFPSRECVEGPWPPESYRRLFGDLPIAPWTEASGLRPPEALNLPDLTANKRGLREAYQFPPGMMMVVSKDPLADAERLLRDFMGRAYRRTPVETEVQRCLAFAREAIDQKACFQDAMRLAYKAALCSPDFLYFRENVEALDGAALASRLSYLLWRTLPDSELRQAAAKGELNSDTGLRRQFERLLAAPEASRFFGDFTGQWLDLRKVHDTSPDRYLFPEYFCDNHLVDSGVAETEATFAEMIRGNLPIQTVVAADFVMVNERLADLYGIDGVHGKDIRRVDLPAASPRGGIMTQSSVLKVTANGLTTSPVLRGAWVLDRILGTPPLDPPPNAGAIEPDTRGANTIRELLAKHSRSESCAACHSSIDPPGFALENFDVMGKWRTRYRSFDKGEPLKLKVANRQVKYKLGLPVDASGVTKEGVRFRDIHEFRKHLLGQQRQLARNLTERLMTFATGAGISFADRIAIEEILDATEPQGYPVRALLERVVLSKIFRSK